MQKMLNELQRQHSDKLEEDFVSGEHDMAEDDDSEDTYYIAPAYIQKAIDQIKGNTSETKADSETKFGRFKNIKRDYVQWVKDGGNKFVPSPEIILGKTVPAGVYELQFSNAYKLWSLGIKNILLDELLILPDPVQDKILEDIKIFWQRRDWFKKYKFVYKRGILLMGPAGSGKSSIINLLSNEIINSHNGIVIFLNTEEDLTPFISFIPLFRQIESDRPVLCIIEDIEGFVQHGSTESTLLNLLDGLNQIDNIVYLATTNYPEKLKERILNRPSRFDRRYQVDFPKDEVREFYLKNKLHEEDLQKINITEWVKKTKGFSLAHLGEMIKSVFALGVSFENTLEIMKNMRKNISSHNFDKGMKGNDEDAIGFNSHRGK